MNTGAFIACADSRLFAEENCTPATLLVATVRPEPEYAVVESTG
jgi:hypothetical protein